MNGRGTRDLFGGGEDFLPDLELPGDSGVIVLLVIIQRIIQEFGLLKIMTRNDITKI